jgi:hypothetical protein
VEPDLKVTITVESFELGDAKITRELDDTGSPKKDEAGLHDLLTDTAQAVRRSYDIAEPF